MALSLFYRRDIKPRSFEIYALLSIVNSHYIIRHPNPVNYVSKKHRSYSFIDLSIHCQTDLGLKGFNCEFFQNNQIVKLYNANMEIFTDLQMKWIATIIQDIVV